MRDREAVLRFPKDLLPEDAAVTSSASADDDVMTASDVDDI